MHSAFRVARRLVPRAAVLFAFALLATPAQAQLEGFENLLGAAAEGGAKPAAEPKIEAQLVPADAKPGDVVTLEVTARIPKGSYTYSARRSSDLGGSPTTIVVETKGLEPLDENFTPDHAPTRELEPLLGKQIEKHKKDVTWSRKFRILSDADPQDVRATGMVRWQVCDDRSCKPLRNEFTAALKSEIPREALAFEARPEISGKPGPATIRVGFFPKDAKPGEKVTLAVRVSLDQDWHTYSVTQKPGNAAQATTIKLADSRGLKPGEKEFEPTAPPEIKKVELPNDTLTQEVHHGEVTWTREFEVTEEDYAASGTIRYQICDASRCLQPTTVAFKIEREPAERTAAAAGAEEKTVAGAASPESASAVSEGGVDRSKGLIAFIIAAALAGFAALLTPCVFPMIPITVSFFLKQSEREHHRPVGMALIYCAGIIMAFTGLGMLMSILFEATALNRLSNNPWLNLGIAGVLVFFGLNLLGMFEIRIPSGLLTWSSNKETQGGIVGTLFMALTFTLVSFTCTFAFLGALLVWAAKGEFFWPVIGMLAFSAAFSLPFFFLALFPSFLQKLPKSGGWMNTVKVSMGLIEIGAAIKFLSVADLAWNPTPLLFDYSMVAIGWMVIAIVAGVYLFGLIRLPHDTPVQSISVQRLMFATGFLGLAMYLAVGLFAPKKPEGILWANIASFLPPRLEGAETDLGPVLLHDGLEYALDYEQALKVARTTKQPVFLDFTGVNCVNCRKMEAVMEEPHLRERLAKFIRVQLYTDNVPTVADEAKAEALLAKNRILQEEWLGDVTLPAYAIVTPDLKILASTMNLQPSHQFARFLDAGLMRWQKVADGDRVGTSAVAAALP